MACLVAQDVLAELRRTRPHGSRLRTARYGLEFNPPSRRKVWADLDGPAANDANPASAINATA